MCGSGRALLYQEDTETRCLYIHSFCPSKLPLSSARRQEGGRRCRKKIEMGAQHWVGSVRSKSEFDKMMERRATDFRLDPSLRKYCKYDISEVRTGEPEESSLH